MPLNQDWNTNNGEKQKESSEEKPSTVTQFEASRFIDIIFEGQDWITNKKVRTWLAGVYSQLFAAV